MPRIKSATALRIYLSNSRPSVSVAVISDRNICGRASMPLGFNASAQFASFADRILTEVRSVSQLLIGREFGQQQDFDSEVSERTNTIELPEVRAKVAFLLSTAFARACALERNQPLYQFIAESFELTSCHTLPCPLITMVSGGVVTTTNFHTQSLMIVPVGISDGVEAIRAGSEISAQLGVIYEKSARPFAYGDEGGYSTHHPDAGQMDSYSVLAAAMKSIAQATVQAGYRVGTDVEFAIDFAADHTIRGPDRYALVTERSQLSPEDVIALCDRLVGEFPVRFLEDPLSTLHRRSLKALHEVLGKRAKIVGDDLAPLETRLFDKEMDSLDAVIIMPDRLGTISDAIDYANQLRAGAIVPIVSARSGETEDAFVADLAVALSAPFIKIGGMCRADRTAKYNQLLRISEQLQMRRQDARYSGGSR